MKNFVRFAKIALSVGVFYTSALPVQADDKPNFALVEKLPERESAAKKTAHEGWDSGVTAKMLAATNAYNDALTSMLNDLAAAYYAKAKLTKEEVAAYVKALRSTAEFRHKIDNPAAEDRGTLDALEAPGLVSNDLEDTIEQMAQTVTQDDEKFNAAAWEKRWTEAKNTGDTDPTAASPAPAVPAAGKSTPAATAKPAKPEKGG